MKFKVEPQGRNSIYDAVFNAIKLQVDAMDLSQDEKTTITESRTFNEQIKMCRWVEYGYGITVEFDTEAMTATVVDRHQLPYNTNGN